MTTNTTTKTAPSAPSADFSFCIPADCRAANYALLLADRHMRWFEDFDPYGVEFDDRDAVLLETAATLLRGGKYASQLVKEIENALGEFDDEESDLYKDGEALFSDIARYIDKRRGVEW